ncbi:uncharacterized protein LOC143342412 isoform X2 [Colletes latitarsis]|uniref:uncharacterized protein LOC143342412 isoform X2 n=1 Tax=Colletes latitarsis TaxID=2605962 RepID=UPI004035C055
MCTVRNKESVSHRSTISPERRRAESASKKVHKRWVQLRNNRNPASMSLAVRCKDQSEHERGRRREARLTRVKQRVADLLRRSRAIRRKRIPGEKEKKKTGTVSSGYARLRSRFAEFCRGKSPL